MNKNRCGWVNEDPLSIAYHDSEWGVPVREERLLFEFLMLEGMQAGLSWITILKKRPAYREAFAQFDAQKIAQYDAEKIAELMQNQGIIRNRLKINAIINNARAYLDFQVKGESFSAFLWQFVDNEPVVNHWKTLAEVPATTDASEKMAKALKRRGFKFVGTTICYAFMQAVGMVNDHVVDCFCHPSATAPALDAVNIDIK